MSDRCVRPGCGAQAVASLTYNYAARMVWLDDLSPEGPPVWGICPAHAERLRVPEGWVREDRRQRTLT